MQPTILPGDVVVIDKLAYDLRVPFTFTRLARWADPARGDIVVCFSPEDGTRLVKRIVALPGDTVELRDDVLWLNGIRQTYTPLPADAPGVRDLPAAERASAIFAREHLAASSLSRAPAASAAPDDRNPHPAARSHAVMALPARPALRTWGPVRVPAGHYWALGDNRDNSHDSRFNGPVPRSAIIGRVRAVAVSADLDRWMLPRFGRFFTALE
jgi:signal peptidase I